MATNTLTASTSDTFTHHPGEYKCVNIDIRVATDRIEVLEGVSLALKQLRQYSDVYLDVTINTIS